MKMFYAMVCSVLFCSASACAATPALGTYNCKGKEDLQHNLENAKYIVVARLEKYLPDNIGEYRVLMNLRGPIQPGEILHQGAIPVVPGVGGMGGTPLGFNAVYLGQEYERGDGFTILKSYECSGFYGAAKVGGENRRPGLYPIIDYILDEKK